MKMDDMIEIDTFPMKTLLVRHKNQIDIWCSAVELSNRLHHVRKQVLIGIDDDDDDNDNDIFV